MTVARDENVEVWLGGVVRAYQTLEDPPTLPDLFRLERPTYMVGLGLRRSSYLVVGVAVVHDDVGENAGAFVMVGDRIEDLAEMAENVESVFGRDGEVLQRRAPEYRGVEPRTIATHSALRVAQLAGSISLSSEPSAAGWREAALLPDGLGALWFLVFPGDLPDATKFVAELIERETRMPEPSSSFVDSRPAEHEPPDALGACLEPLVWFGEVPRLSVREQILDIPRWLPFEERVVATAEVMSLPTAMFNSGRIVVATSDRRRAGAVVNQVAAAADRCGIPFCRAIPKESLSELGGLDITTWRWRSLLSTGRDSQLNRLLSNDLPVFVAPEDAASTLLEMAHRCGADADQAEVALRLLQAKSHQHAHLHKEAFLNAWMLIEWAVGREYERYVLATTGRPPSASRRESIYEQISVLHAAGCLPEGVVLHELRNIRNRIVHNLGEASPLEALRAIQQAEIRLGLPRGHIVTRRERI